MTTDRWNLSRKLAFITLGTALLTLGFAFYLVGGASIGLLSKFESEINLSLALYLAANAHLLLLVALVFFNAGKTHSRWGSLGRSVVLLLPLSTFAIVNGVVISQSLERNAGHEWIPLFGVLTLINILSVLFERAAFRAKPSAVAWQTNEGDSLGGDALRLTLSAANWSVRLFLLFVFALFWAFLGAVLFYSLRFPLFEGMPIDPRTLYVFFQIDLPSSFQDFAASSGSLIVFFSILALLALLLRFFWKVLIQFLYPSRSPFPETLTPEQVANYQLSEQQAQTVNQYYDRVKRYWTDQTYSTLTQKVVHHSRLALFLWAAIFSALPSIAVMYLTTEAVEQSLSANTDWFLYSPFLGAFLILGLILTLVLGWLGFQLIGRLYPRFAEHWIQRQTGLEGTKRFWLYSIQGALVKDAKRGNLRSLDQFSPLLIIHRVFRTPERPLLVAGLVLAIVTAYFWRLDKNHYVFITRDSITYTDYWSSTPFQIGFEDVQSVTIGCSSDEDGPVLTYRLYFDKDHDADIIRSDFERNLEKYEYVDRKLRAAGIPFSTLGEDSRSFEGRAAYASRCLGTLERAYGDSIAQRAMKILHQDEVD